MREGGHVVEEGEQFRLLLLIHLPKETGPSYDLLDLRPTRVTTHSSYDCPSRRELRLPTQPAWCLPTPRGDCGRASRKNACLREHRRACSLDATSGKQAREGEGSGFRVKSLGSRVGLRFRIERASRGWISSSSSLLLSSLELSDTQVYEP